MGKNSRSLEPGSPELFEIPEDLPTLPTSLFQVGVRVVTLAQAQNGFYVRSGSGPVLRKPFEIKARLFPSEIGELFIVVDPLRGE